jgi:hypothetical protein
MSHGDAAGFVQHAKFLAPAGVFLGFVASAGVVGAAASQLVSLMRLSCFGASF